MYLVYAPIVFSIDLHDKYFHIFNSSYSQPAAYMLRTCSNHGVWNALIAAAETTNKLLLQIPSSTGRGISMRAGAVQSQKQASSLKLINYVRSNDPLYCAWAVAVYLPSAAKIGVVYYLMCEKAIWLDILHSCDTVFSLTCGS